jgi:hypothetical protein
MAFRLVAHHIALLRDILQRGNEEVHETVCSETVSYLKMLRQTAHDFPLAKARLSLRIGRGGEGRKEKTYSRIMSLSCDVSILKVQ